MLTVPYNERVIYGEICKRCMHAILTWWRPWNYNVHKCWRKEQPENNKMSNSKTHPHSCCHFPHCQSFNLETVGLTNNRGWRNGSIQWYHWCDWSIPTVESAFFHIRPIKKTIKWYVRLWARLCETKSTYEAREQSLFASVAELQTDKSILAK